LPNHLAPGNFSNLCSLAGAEQLISRTPTLTASENVLNQIKRPDEVSLNRPLGCRFYLQRVFSYNKLSK